jgi:hypothetical protein
MVRDQRVQPRTMPVADTDTRVTNQHKAISVPRAMRGETAS